jgi:hypothetical protein
MSRKSKPSAALIDRMRGEASWLLSHAQALAAYRRPEEAAAELARAATSEEEAACLLDAAGEEREAAIHRASAASCHEKLGQHTRAVTLLRAALSVDLPQEFRGQVEEQLARFLAGAHQTLRGSNRTGQRPPVRTPTP